MMWNLKKTKTFQVEIKEVDCSSSKTSWIKQENGGSRTVSSLITPDPISLIRFHEKFFFDRTLAQSPRTPARFWRVFCLLGSTWRAQGQQRDRLQDATEEILLQNTQEDDRRPSIRPPCCRQVVIRAPLSARTRPFIGPITVQQSNRDVRAL